MRKILLFLLVLLSVTIPTKSQNQEWFTWDLGNEDMGDCELRNARFVVYSNGNAKFSAKVRTRHTHSGDFWHIKITVFELTHPNNIFFTREFSSTRLDDDKPFIDWVYEFKIDPKVITREPGLRHDCGC